MKTLDRTKAISIAMISVLSISISLSTLATPSYASTPTKKLHMAGRVTNSSTNTLRNGKGAPTSALGIDGDFYIDTLKFNLYGPKANGRWPTPVSLRGPAGVNGANGKAGTNGVSGKNGASGGKGSTTSVAGPKGAQGLTGAQGPIGLTGPQGVQGATGAAGPSGIKGDTGATGAAGTTGATGPAGPMGAPGSMGASGSPGSMGPQGATGPSNVQVVPISSWQLSTTTAGTGNSSAAFGNLAASKSYEFMFGINGRLATNQSPTYASQVGLTLHCSDLAATITYSVSSAFGYSNNGDATTYSKESFIVIGTIATTGVNPTSTFTVTATDSGPTTGTDVMTLSGSAFIQLVGSLT
ncbi:MAG: hypothetical protein WCP71_04700 [Actinomycetes bacterium]